MILKGGEDMGEKKQRLLFVATHAEDQQERATIPFVLANAALAVDRESIVVLQLSGVWLGVKNYASHIHAAGFPPLAELIEVLQEQGGKIWVCAPCIQSRQISPEDLIPRAEVVAGTALVDAVLDAAHTMVY
jgi:uncharacterized protein involved in oxidation of intracellular sulfur